MKCFRHGVDNIRLIICNDLSSCCVRQERRQVKGREGGEWSVRRHLLLSETGDESLARVVTVEVEERPKKFQSYSGDLK